MKDISKYSVNNLLNEYFKNKELINAYVSGQNIENFAHDDDKRNGSWSPSRWNGITSLLLVYVQ